MSCGFTRRTRLRTHDSEAVFELVVLRCLGLGQPGTSAVWLVTAFIVPLGAGRAAGRGSRLAYIWPTLAGV